MKSLISRFFCVVLSCAVLLQSCFFVVHSVLVHSDVDFIFSSTISGISQGHHDLGAKGTELLVPGSDFGQRHDSDSCASCQAILVFSAATTGRWQTLVSAKQNSVLSIAHPCGSFVRKKFFNPSLWRAPPDVASVSA